jgi:hypothetical protein
MRVISHALYENCLFWYCLALVVCFPGLAGAPTRFMLLLKVFALRIGVNWIIDNPFYTGTRSVRDLAGKSSSKQRSLHN